MAQPNGPLYGRPPFGTDMPDSAYDSTFNDPVRRQRQQDPQGNRPTSAYNVYDNYIDEKNQRQSGYGDLGADLLNGDIDDSDDETIAIHQSDIKHSFSDEKMPPPPSLLPGSGNAGVAIVAPRPGYAATPQALTIPEPTATPAGQPRHTGQPQMQQGGAPYSPTVPSTPHPLQAPSTPITPAFARPPKPAEIKFEADSIMRGHGEDVPLSRRGQRGDEFWRRFSMVVKEEGGRKNTSSWLEKTQNRSASMSRLIWIIGILLLVIIGGAVGFGVYISHNAPSSSPKALGGSENQGFSVRITTTDASGKTTTSVGVSPTNTVARRWAEPMPDPFAFANPNPLPEPTPMVISVVHKTGTRDSNSNSSSAKRHLRNKRRLVLP